MGKADNSESENLLPQKNILPLGRRPHLDLTGLTDEQKQMLKTKQAEKFIDEDVRVQKLGADHQAMDATLGTMARHTAEVDAEGNAVTISNVREDSLGRTEVIMGNTGAAAKGKLSRSQAGEKDMTHTYLWFALGALVVLAFLLAAIFGR